MPEFCLTATTTAPVEEVWKLLHDPSRFPEWWVGIETIRTDGVRTDGVDHYTMWPAGYPDFPMAQQLRTDRTDGRVTISCLVSDLEYCWQLSEQNPGTGITVTVQIPPAEAHRLQPQQDMMATSLRRLVTLAATAA